MGLLSLLGTAAGAFFGGPAGAAIGSSLGGAFEQNDGINQASYDQRLASDRSLALQKERADRAYNDQAPYRAQGVNALSMLAGELGQRTSAADVLSDPGYQFGLEQGQQRMDRQFAAAGGRVSGAAIKEAARFGVGAATAGYGAADQRRENRLARLQMLAGLGQSATNSSGQTGMQYGANAGATMVNQGDNAGSGRLAQGNIWANTGNQIAALYGKYNNSPTPETYQSGGGFGSVSGGYVDPGTGQTYNNPSAYSDARLKKNIRPIGITARGNTICAWDWKTGGSGMGVIAQEVAHIPGAVHDDADGILMVDYSKV